MRLMKRALTLILCLVLLIPSAFAEETATPAPTEEPSIVEDYVEDDGMSEIVGTADQELPSIEGLTPLYTTKIKLMTATGTAASIRAAQDENSQSLARCPRTRLSPSTKSTPLLCWLSTKASLAL